MNKPRETDGYEIQAYPVSDLAACDVDACIELVTMGEALDSGYVTQGLPQARLIAIARKDGKVVGVGVIKCVRHEYAAKIAARSAANFSDDTPEVGYFAVHPDHRGRGFSHRLLGALLQQGGPRLLATTSNDAMKRTLSRAGFFQRGAEWNGKASRLSLWLKE